MCPPRRRKRLDTLCLAAEGHGEKGIWAHGFCRRAQLIVVSSRGPRLPAPVAGWFEPGGPGWIFLRGTGRFVATVPGSMIPVSPATRIDPASGATDLRQSFEGGSDLVTPRFHQDPLRGYLFVFANRRKNRIKPLFFDGSGVWVCAKAALPGPKPPKRERCASWPGS